MDLIQKLNWRYAAKRMTGAKVPQEKVERILDAVRLSASSGGLQPYTVLVVKNEELLKKIQPIAHNQPQIVEASHLLIFAAWDKLTEERIEDYINHVAAVRKVPVETLAVYKSRLSGLMARPEEVNFNWSARQAYIALGTALIAAAEEAVDATPMEGFIPEALDELLGLSEKGLRSVVIVALGYRDAEKDVFASATKVRREKEELFVVLD